MYKNFDDIKGEPSDYDMALMEIVSKQTEVLSKLMLEFARIQVQLKKLQEKENV